jgi:hypothetical protein
MALKRPAGAIRFLSGSRCSTHSCDFAPISTFRIRVELAQIRDDVLLVVNGQYGIGPETPGRKIFAARCKECFGKGRKSMLSA